MYEVKTFMKTSTVRPDIAQYDPCIIKNFVHHSNSFMFLYQLYLL